MEKEESKYWIYVRGQQTNAGTYHWNTGKRPVFNNNEEGLYIIFPMHFEYKRRIALSKLKEALIQNSVSWIFEKNDHWTIIIDELYKNFPSLLKFEWLEGTVAPELEIVTKQIDSDHKKQETTVQFIITKREVELSMPKRIFLSHKNCDKPVVREYFDTLKQIGFDPWLDEDAMAAGLPLERALIAGMKDSCAAVFFITPSYVDESFLASEINYAMEQKREKGNRFSIITLVFSDGDARKSKVPDLLKQFVWKEPKDNLQAIKEIIRALPIEVKQISWRDI
jgi:hypothetical protein